MMRLDSLSAKSATLWLKAEWTDPEGQDPIRSIKRKPACLLFSDVIEKRYAEGKKLLISATSGNFGIEVGLLAASRGLPFCAVVPAAIPEYNLRVLAALGVNVIRTEEQETCPREFTVFYVRGYAHEFHHRLVNLERYYFWLSPLAHSMTTGPEISYSMGIPAGPSSGMALAHRMIGEGATGNIVVISPDSNFKYGDLIVAKLEELGDQIMRRFPELKLGDSLYRYVDHLLEKRGDQWMLDRLKQCYPIEQPGSFFKARDIEDIVTGRAVGSPALT